MTVDRDIVMLDFDFFLHDTVGNRSYLGRATFEIDAALIQDRPGWFTGTVLNNVPMQLKPKSYGPELPWMNIGDGRIDVHGTMRPKTIVPKEED